jgi:hypothetical protein
VKQLEEYVLTLQRVTLTSQIREIGRMVETAQISTDAKEEVRKALAEAYASLESEKLDVRTIDAVVVVFSEAISKSGSNGADVRECLDKCKEAYDNAKAECDKIEDGIERANCVIAAVNRWINCTNACIPPAKR